MLQQPKDETRWLFYQLQVGTKMLLEYGTNNVPERKKKTLFKLHWYWVSY